MSDQAIAFLRALRASPYNIQLTAEDVRQGKLPAFGQVNNSDATCLVWGDSHAMAVMPGIVQASKDRGIRCYQATHSSTPPLLGFDSRELHRHQTSPEFNLAVADFAIDQGVDVVILVASWSSYVEQDFFEESLRATLDKLESAGIRVVVLRDYPSATCFSPRVLALAEDDGFDTRKIGIPLELHRKDQELVDRTLEEVVGGRTVLADPAPSLIDGDSFLRAEYNKVSMYRDSSHLSIEGGRRLTKLFLGLFQQLSLPPAPSKGG